jgi:phosphatidylinositol glycan class C protein
MNVCIDDHLKPLLPIGDAGDGEILSLRRQFCKREFLCGAWNLRRRGLEEILFSRRIGVGMGSEGKANGGVEGWGSQFEEQRQDGKNHQGHHHQVPWKKVVYGGMQCGYADNYMDSSFLEAMVMNANVVKRDTATVMVDSVGIASHVSVVALVATVWTHALNGALPASSLLLLDALVLLLGFLSLLLTIKCVFSLAFVVQIGRNFILFVSAIYVLAPVFQTLTRSISSDSIWALTVSLLVVHLFCHDYTFSTSPPSPMAASLSRDTNGKKPPKGKETTLSANVSMNASIVASVLIASRLPTHLYVFALMLFSLEFFLLFPLVTHCIRQRSVNLHLGFSCTLIFFTMGLIFPLSRLVFVLFITVIVFITLVCPYWLIRIQEYKFEINGPWDEAKLCFDLD